MSRKKEKIRIIKKDSSKEEDYTFVNSNNVLNNIKNNNES